MPGNSVHLPVPGSFTESAIWLKKRKKREALLTKSLLKGDYFQEKSLLKRENILFSYLIRRFPVLTGTFFALF